LKRHGFPPAALSILAKESPEVLSLLEQALGSRGERFELREVGPVVAHGPLLEALKSADAELAKVDLPGTLSRVGFQYHDGYIFQVLVGRGGVLVAVRSEPRAADALATLHSYGGGNAAIGAWTGRV
jgi:hypothetical protein